MPAYKRVVIAGVGLIGGSIGLALRERQLAEQVVGWVRSEKSGERAIGCGVVDLATADPAEAAAGANLVVVCTPVGSVVEAFAGIAPHCSPETLLTDAGSTKQLIVEQTEAMLAKLSSPAKFVGSHPIAGDHRTGPEAARADLFADRKVVITPTAATSNETVDQATKFWQAMGATVIAQSPAEHDATLARTSHLPHILATALARATPKAALPLAATGWADTTRVAAGSPELWRDILLSNKNEIHLALQGLVADLTDILAAIESADADKLLQILDEGKRRRDALGS